MEEEREARLGGRLCVETDLGSSDRSEGVIGMLHRLHHHILTMKRRGRKRRRWWWWREEEEEKEIGGSKGERERQRAKGYIFCRTSTLLATVG